MAVWGEARLNSHLSPSEFAKRKLILAAIRVFAEHGVDSVSLRMINREAGHKNNSALHYHFGSKMGLIEAMDDFIQQHFDEVREPQLAELECSVNEGKATIRDAMEVFVNPYVQIIKGMSGAMTLCVPWREWSSIPTSRCIDFSANRLAKPQIDLLKQSGQF